MAKFVCALLSVLLHLALLGALWWHVAGPAAPEAVEVDLNQLVEDVRRTFQAAPPAPPAFKPISDRKEGGSYGGRNATEETMFKEFAEAGGLVGSGGQSEGGPKVRFGHILMHSYSEKSLVGHYRTPKGLDVYILDGRGDPRLESFVLFVPDHKMVRRLVSLGNEYMYTYGPELGQDVPAEGSVTFLGDGDRIYSFIWISGARRAVYPQRVRPDEDK
ncbi:MAG: hypothetical protein AB7D57_14325 [Desulfovibrionaceae bacterium]